MSQSNWELVFKHFHQSAMIMKIMSLVREGREKFCLAFSLFSGQNNGSFFHINGLW